MRFPLILFSLVSGIYLFASSPAAAGSDAAWQAFVEPPLGHRPFVRWWWNGSRVNAVETVRQLDAMRAAGIGGVEINTIGLPAYLEGSEGLEEHPALEWLGAAWTDVVLETVAAAKARGMTADIIVGSGWPFGGRFLELEEQSQRMRVVKLELEGPMTYDRPVEAVWEESFLTGVNRTKNRNLTQPNLLQVAALRRVPADHGQRGFDPGTDLMPAQADADRIRAEIPPGAHTLYVVFHEVGYTHVKLGAPGADGPVVDHYNADAVRHYLDMMSSRFEEASGRSMGDLFRATFVDSLELDHSNWTWDFPEVFRERRGYALEPYLPFVLDHDKPVAIAGRAFQEVVRRARYDFVKTLIELFEERFLQTYVDWAAEHGMQARIQAYGRETHPLHGSLIPPLPEGETWLWHDSDTNRGVWEQSTVVNKYVSSGAHLSGKRLVSFEAMTNAVPVFRGTLNNFKRAMDLSLLDGLNHPILHGWNYFPQDAAFPGWIRFGSYVNPNNPFWPQFPRFSDYVGRMGGLSRSGDYQAQVALLSPRAEEWAEHGMLYQPFPEVIDPWYQYMMARALQKVGFGVDYVSERILHNAEYGDGALTYNGRSYPVLVVQNVEAMEPKTARALRRFHRAGGRLVFIGERPRRTPGLLDYAARDFAVQDAVTGLSGERVLDLVPPEKPREVLVPGPRGKYVDDRMLIDHAEQIRRFAGLELPLRLRHPGPHVSQVHFRLDDGRDVFLLFNLHREAAQVAALDFREDAAPTELWNPFTGDRHRLELAAGSRLDLTLQPLESVALVRTPESRAPAAPAVPPATLTPLASEPVATLEGPWQLTLEPVAGGAPFSAELPAPADLSESEDPALARFGGWITYRTTFTLDGDPAGERLFLDLGDVNGTTAVVLNGEALGNRWYGRHLYAVSDALRAGDNTLEIRVSTVLANYVKNIERGNTNRRWAWWYEPIPMGLTEAVKLLPAAESGGGDS